jgi:GDSL-like Lipase/Acylhydrolase family
MPVRLLRSATLLATVLLIATGAAAATASAATGPYVSLGDSYTAAPLVPSPTGNPILCGRSTNNYPSDVARAIAPTSFTDVSCSSATTDDMTQPQNLYNVQTNPPQFNALAPGDSLVTVGIGGNDAGLIGVAEECARLDATTPTGTPCKDYYTADGSDPNEAAINATGPKVANVLNGIHTRAPSAKVLIVGYPDGLPTDGTACWPLVPITAGDITYFNGLEQQLNQVIANDVAANNATFVDTWNSSIGHDACKPPGVAWVNGIVPTSAAFPLHPNQMGEANMARQVLMRWARDHGADRVTHRSTLVRSDP